MVPKLVWGAVQAVENKAALEGMGSDVGPGVAGGCNASGGVVGGSAGNGITGGGATPFLMTKRNLKLSQSQCPTSK